MALIHAALMMIIMIILPIGLTVPELLGRDVRITKVTKHYGKRWQPALYAPDSPLYVTIRVKNNTPCPLVGLNIRVVKDGSHNYTSTEVASGKQETIQFRNRGTHGVYGTLSYEIKGFNRRVLVMYSFPYNTISYSNWMGTGTSARGDTKPRTDNSRWDRMYYDVNTPDPIDFERSKHGRVIYFDNLDPISIEAIQSRPSHDIGTALVTVNNFRPYEHDEQRKRCRAA